MSLQSILDQARFKELVSDALNTYRANYVVEHKGYTLVAMKHVDTPVKCESETIDGSSCGRPIRNVMVVKDHKGNLINVGTTCYKRAMGATDARCPKEAGFESFKADKQLYRRVKLDLDSKVNQLSKQLPAMVAAARTVGINTTESYFRKLLKDGKVSNVVIELMDIQAKYAAHKRRYQPNATDPEYMKKFKADVLKARSYVDHLISVKAPQPVKFDKTLYDLLGKHFTEPVVREIFKYYNKPLPTEVKTSKITSTNPW